LEDLETVFGWRNSPWIVAISTSRREVTWDEHVAWFQSILDRSQHLLFILEVEPDGPVGSLRLDLRGEETADISVYLLQPFTGRGLGTKAIIAGCEAAFAHWPALRQVVADVRCDNRPSIKAFTRALFVPSGPESRMPDGHLRLVRARPGAPPTDLSETD
jgi:RimJ/RimL family protein N-acetyltransferase